MMPCPVAPQDDKRAAMSASRVIRRVYKANTSVYLCGECDKYHATIEIGRYPVSESWQRVLECLAQGMTREETGLATNLGPRGVDWAIEEMRKRFYALNRPHLVAIAISLGIVDPAKFVPSIEKEDHEHRTSS